MAASKNPAIRLRHVLDEADAIQRATRDLTFDEFRTSWMLRRAVEHGLMIIAEAIKAIPDDLKQQEPQIPWPRIESLGNVLRHEYKDVDPTVLWRIVREQLPDLIAAAQRMLTRLEQ